MNTVINHWHTVVTTKDTDLLLDLLSDDVVFHSPIVHTPQKGKKLTFLYLSAALQVFFSGKFEYVREVIDGSDAMLEFKTEIDGVIINGIDMITWNKEGKIIDFKVMIRPLKAVNLVHQKMGALLAQYQKK